MFHPGPGLEWAAGLGPGSRERDTWSWKSPEGRTSGIRTQLELGPENSGPMGDRQPLCTLLRTGVGHAGNQPGSGAAAGAPTNTVEAAGRVSRPWGGASGLGCAGFRAQPLLLQITGTWYMKAIIADGDLVQSPGQVFPLTVTAQGGASFQTRIIFM